MSLEFDEIAPPHWGPVAALDAMVETGELKPDGGQQAAIGQLQSVHDGLISYRRDRRPGSVWGWLQGLLAGGRPAAPPHGLYIHGPVGRGKSMLMDLFFDTAPITAKRRVHFHAFMLEVQERLNGYREHTIRDPLAALASEIAAENLLLCFDEFHVVNIADAMILGRLFAGFIEAGTIIVATSNVAPADLYKGGLQRANFLPFIALIEARLGVVDIGTGDDHRRLSLAGGQVYFSPLGDAARLALDSAFAAMTVGKHVSPRVLDVRGRVLHVAVQAPGVARFGFAELCEQPLGAADYLAVAAHYHCVLLDDIPRLGPTRLSAAKRLVVLIDTLYEHKVKLICAADTEPDHIYDSGDVAFEFQRAASRLIEMQSRAYLEAPHAPPCELPDDPSEIL